MAHLHEELRKARETAGLSQQALADLAGIPRNQVVRAERGENITVETLRRIAAHLPLTELSLLDTKGLRLRVDIIPEPEKLFIAAVENVIQLASALDGAIRLAIDARTAMEAAHRAAPSPPEGYKRSADVAPLLLLRSLKQITGELAALKIAS
jgi:transcriptional regulator with XRE-family HTH domain